MLLTAKYFCDFLIDASALPPKNFNFLIQKIKAVEQWKVDNVSRINCQYFAGILSYLEY